MLEEIYLEDFVLFEKASLAFTSGLNAISGETGAGKSLIATALSQALGERANTDAIRSGADKAVVSVVFLVDSQTLREQLTQYDIMCDSENRLTLERTIRRDGRSRMSVNGRPASTTAVRSAAGMLLDMSAQNEQTRLMEPAYQRELLDRYGKLAEDVEEFRASHAAAQSLNVRLHAGAADREQVRKRLAEVRDQLNQLDALAFDIEVDATIEERIRLLSNAEEILALAEDAINTLYEDEDSVQDLVGSLVRRASTAAADCPALLPAAESVQNLADNLEETVRSFREVAGSVEHNPGELESLIARAESIKALARKLNCEWTELPVTGDSLRNEEAGLSGWESDTDDVRRQLEKKVRELVPAGLAIRKKRKRAGTSLAKAVDRELAALGMKEAGFAVKMTPLWNEGDDDFLSSCSPSGLDDISFILSPNPGEAASALSETASGGESSRAMLAIKSTLSEVYSPPVLLFDEIDSGVGGRFGEVIATKLQALAGSRQVITITHLPQIAARADNHLKVSKESRNARTYAQAHRLSGQERVEEVAAMIHGTAANATTVRQAKEMIG